MSKKESLKEGNRPHQIRATAEVFDMLRAKGQDASDGLEAFVEESLAMTERAKGAERQVESLQARLNEAENRITVFEENSTERQNKITSLETEKANLQNEKQALKEQLAEANQTVAQQVNLQAAIEKERDDYREEKIRVEKEFKGYKDQVREEREARAKKITELESSISVKTRTIERAKGLEARFKKIAIAATLFGGLCLVLYLSKLM